ERHPMSQITTPQRPATFADLKNVPERMIGEIIGGTLITSPPPATPHAPTATGLTTRLVRRLEHGQGGPGGWWFLFEPELHLREDALVPDLAGWRKERLPKLPNVAALTIAPDWVCEILSTSTAKTDRVDKLPIYHRERVSHVWFIDPLAHSLEVLARM